uniref:Uncharacterized protein n=1 Tax=Anguilla anguilla TaxID=7936 RepID=A0A0E9TNY1_ANGAN
MATGWSMAQCSLQCILSENVRMQTSLRDQKKQNQRVDFLTGKTN